MERIKLTTTDQVLEKIKSLPLHLFHEHYMIDEKILSEALAVLMMNGRQISKRVYLKRVDGTMLGGQRDWN